MTTRIVTLQCQYGLHLRVATQVAKIAQSSQAAVRITCQGCEHADACSALQLLTLGATHGATLELEAEGPGEDAVLDALTDVFEHGGGI